MPQVIIISFNEQVVSHAKTLGFSTGWVVDAISADNQQLANLLRPNYLITDVKLIDRQQPNLWQPPVGHHWAWMLYDVMDAKGCKALLDQGIDLIETGDIVAVIQQIDDL